MSSRRDLLIGVVAIAALYGAVTARAATPGLDLDDPAANLQALLREADPGFFDAGS